MADTDTAHLLKAEAQLVLEEARKAKSERVKTVGSPIQLPGKPLAIQIHDGNAWVADNTTVVRKIDLETGKNLQIYRGHSGPVTALTFRDKIEGSGDRKILITGSWDKTIKLWDTETKDLISSTDAHSDFVKSLFYFPSLKLLVSGSSDKSVRLWDLSTVNPGEPLRSVGSVSSHTRPVACIDGQALSATSAVLYTADTMGVIKVWDLKMESGEPHRWQCTLKNEFQHHRTRINEMLYGNDKLWTASADQTVQVVPESHTPTSQTSKPLSLVTHPSPVRAILPLSLTDLGEPYLITGAGDVIRVYDISYPEEPEFISEVDAHWHDVTALRLWVRKLVGDDGKTRVEPWIISSSLDYTIRKWRLSELLNPVPPTIETKPSEVVPTPTEPNAAFQMTEEEERELAELLDSE